MTLRLGHEIDEIDGGAIGRDPRAMTQEELLACGHTPKPILDAIRAKCVDCCHFPGEVRKCVSVTCDLWPFRMGSNPFRAKREMTDAERAATGERLKQSRKNRKV